MHSKTYPTKNKQLPLQNIQCGRLPHGAIETSPISSPKSVWLPSHAYIVESNLQSLAFSVQLN